MKSFIKAIVVAATIISMGFAFTAFASSVNNGNIATLKTTTASLSNSDWGSTSYVDAGDKVAFQLHYYVNEGEVSENTRFIIENLNGRTFSAGDSETVTGRIASGNLTDATGAVTVNFRDNVELSWYNTSWQINPCGSVGCEESLSNDQANDVLTSSGLNLGTINGDVDYAGNVIIEFRAREVSAPTYNDCSYGVDHGESQTFYQSSSVDYGQTCRAETRTCNDGNLSGSYTYTSCSVDNPPVVNDTPAEVTTRSATNIDEDSATLRGSLDINDVNSGDVYFEWGTSRSNLNRTTSDEGVNSNESFDARISGLNDDTTYYYRAVFEGDDGEDDFGSILSFRTDEDRPVASNDDEPEATTESARNIQSTSATIRGEIDMNDFRDGLVFFVFGEDQSDVADARTESSYANIDTNGDDLRKVIVDNDLNSQDEYSLTIQNLDSNTRHYYAMCVEFEDDNDREDLVCGPVESFTTDRSGNTNPPVVQPPVVQPPVTDSATITQVATGVTTNSATLRSFVRGEGNATCYFQYGRTTNFGLTSPAQTVNLDQTSSCASTRFNLQPNTTYFYRSVLIDEGETKFGLTRSFRTNSNPVVVTPRPPVTTPRPVTNPTPTPEVVVTVVEEVEFEGVNQVELIKFISHEDDERFSDDTEADKGDIVFHKIAIRNNGSETLRDIVVTDFIPFELELDRNERIDDDSEKQVSWRIGRLEAGEEREFVTELRVRDDSSVRYGDNIRSIAQASNDDFSVSSNDVELEVEERNEVVEEASQAASIFGAGFWPTSIVGWLLLLAIVLFIAYIISRMLFARRENERVLAELRAMQK